MNFVPSTRTLKLSLIAALTTFTFLLFEKLIGPTQICVPFSLNNKMVAESLTLRYSVPAIVIAMLPGLFAIIFANSLNLDDEKRICLLKLDSDLNLETDLPDSFPPDRWLNTPAGVWAFYGFSDVLLLKVGASITSTVAGASLYLFLFGFLEWWLFVGSLLLAYMFSIYQNFV
jgi:hypothetical protein